MRNPACLIPILVLLCLAGCGREKGEPSLGAAYVSSSAVNLRDRLGATQITVTTLKSGQRLEILQKRRRWLRVRVSPGIEGWIEDRHVITQEGFDGFEKLRQSAARKASQGQAHARRDLNLHLEPTLKSPYFFQLKEDEACDVLARAVSERPPRAGQGNRQGTASAVPKEPPEPEMEDWFLVRTPDKAGWGLARSVEMNVPEEILQYAEGKRVVAWTVLAPGDSKGGEDKPVILWAATDRQGLPYDFTTVRVFVWGGRRKRYETMFIEHNLKGYYPIQVLRRQTEEGEVPGFALTTENKQGVKSIREFLFQGRRVRRVPRRGEQAP